MAWIDAVGRILLEINPIPAYSTTGCSPNILIAIPFQNLCLKEAYSMQVMYYNPLWRSLFSSFSSEEGGDYCVPDRSWQISTIELSLVLISYIYVTLYYSIIYWASSLHISRLLPYYTSWSMKVSIIYQINSLRDILSFHFVA